MIIKSETAMKIIYDGNATYEGVTTGVGDLPDIVFAIINVHDENYDLVRVDHVEIEKHVIGNDFEAVVLEDGIVFSHNSAGTEVYADFETMVECIGEDFRKELEAAF